ncbi:MAG TPA: thiamine pyrophosphate-dependent enzyme, partial [Anaerolineales bacterium]|nr:thiamine pyrophosphate-dependent enzyme [Anaerolineales bacterium]
MEETIPLVKLLHTPLKADEIIADYRLAYRSRQASLIGRREVLSGKAKFGIFGDGKEIAQIAMAKAFRNGDFRAGYYRDQTFMFAVGECSFKEFFAQLYANPDVADEPASAGRQMNAHFATRSLNDDGSWKNLLEIRNSAADLSPTGSQMPKLVGLAYASRLYRELDSLKDMPEFSESGNEIAFGTIGNASCAEGMFWESLNAVGVLKSPLILSIWDDGYGISVPNEYQILNEDISALLSGFQRRTGSPGGYDIYRVKAWDYPGLLSAYQAAARLARAEHIPAIVHVTEATQPQGHSTSGSHERYKTPERLAWEVDFDCLHRMRSWILSLGIASAEQLDEAEERDRLEVEEIRKEAWAAFIEPAKTDIKELESLLAAAAEALGNSPDLLAIRQKLGAAAAPGRRDGIIAARDALIALAGADHPARDAIRRWKVTQQAAGVERFGSHLNSESDWSALAVPEVKPEYADQAPSLNGFEILNACFDAMLARDPRVVAFGEDLGFLGDVNQAFAGLQAKYGPLRVSDTGIREATIIGQAIGLAMRGLRPIAEIQYLDYILYGLQILSDDLATLHWRTRGGQKAPVIVRTRGHRLEGIWHSG